MIDDLLSSSLPVPELPPAQHWVEADPDDNWVVQCALTAGAELIVTGDSSLLKLSEVEAIPVRSPGEFLAELAALTAPSP